MKQKLLEQEIDKKISKTTKSIKLFIISISTVVVLVLVFSQVFFFHKSKDYRDAERLYVEAVNRRGDADEKLKSVLSKFHSNQISKERLHSELLLLTPLVLQLEKESEVLSNEYDEIKKKNRFFGFRSIKIFLAHLGLPVLITYLGLYLLILFFKEEDLFFRKVTLMFSVSAMITGIFYITWVFYTKPDLPQNLYVLLLFIISVIGTIATFLIGRYLFALSQINLKLKIQDLLSFIISDVKTKYISKKDRSEYTSDYLKEIEKLSKKI